jgi:hypothetical protein
MKPFCLVSPSKIIDVWGDAHNVNCITEGGLSNIEVLDLLKEFNDEGGIQLSDNLYSDVNKKRFYVLWVNGCPVGVLVIFISTRFSRNASRIYIEPNAVFILEKFRGIRLGADLSSTVARIVSTELIHKITKSKLQTGDQLRVTLYAAFESEEGEAFVNIFFYGITDGAFNIVSSNWGLSVNYESDTGY